MHIITTPTQWHEDRCVIFKTSTQVLIDYKASSSCAYTYIVIYINAYVRKCDYSGLQVLPISDYLFYSRNGKMSKYNTHAGKQKRSTTLRQNLQVIKKNTRITHINTYVCIYTYNSDNSPTFCPLQQ